METSAWGIFLRNLSKLCLYPRCLPRFSIKLPICRKHPTSVPNMAKCKQQSRSKGAWEWFGCDQLPSERSSNQAMWPVHQLDGLTRPPKKYSLSNKHVFWKIRRIASWCGLERMRHLSILNSSSCNHSVVKHLLSKAHNPTAKEQDRNFRAMRHSNFWCRLLGKLLFYNFCSMSRELCNPLLAKI